MHNTVVIKEFVKARATDLDYGIFRARIVEDLVDDLYTIEFGSRGGWGQDGGTMILTRGEFGSIMEVLRKAEEMMNSIPDDDDLADDEFDDDLADDEDDDDAELDNDDDQLHD